MRRIIWSFLALTFMVLAPLAAHARAPASPTFKEGTHLYSSPARFLPAGFGQRNADAVEAFAKAQPIPTFVVLFNSDGNRIEPHRLGDKFASDWAKQGLDTERFLILTVAWSSHCDRPPKRRTKGKDFCQVGFSMPQTLGAVYGHRAQSMDRKRHFIPKVAKNPQDLKGGLVNTIRVANEKVWPKIDPVQVARRELRAAVRAHEGALATAQGLLAATPYHPKTGVASYATAYQQAKGDALQADAKMLRSSAQELNSAMVPLALHIRTARRAEEVRLGQLATARGDLDTQISTLAELLSQEEHLPVDVSGYRQTLASAQSIRKTDNTKKMAGMAAEMEPGIKTLSTQVLKAEDAARMATLTSFLLWGMALAFLALLVFLVSRRFGLFSQLKEELTLDIQDWDSKISSAMGRYTEFQFQDREDLVAFGEVKGRTREVYDRTTAMIDSIYSNILGIQTHIRRCEVLGNSATVFNLQPLRDALTKLTANFEFDTGELNQADLFGGETVTMTVNPGQFAAEQAETFSKAKNAWADLKRAAEARTREAEESFPHHTMDRLFEMCAEAGVPKGWVSDHPLYGNDEADAVFYQEINALRWEDPLAYLERLESLAVQETGILARVQRVMQDIQTLKDARFTRALSFDSIVLGQADPRITLDAAQTADDKYMALLETSAAAKDEASLIKPLDSAISLYGKVRKQAAEIRMAIQGVQTAQARTDKALKSAEAAGEAANASIAQARKIHTDLLTANRNVEAGNRAFAGARSDASAAQRLLLEKRHVQAHRVFNQALRGYKAAKAAYNEASAHCVKLGRRKAAFEKKLSGMHAVMARKVENIHTYGGKASRIAAFRPPSLGEGSSGLVDYAAALMALEGQENAWEDEVRAARRTYEAEQARIRAERERRRREEERRERAAQDRRDAEERRHRQAVRRAEEEERAIQDAADAARRNASSSWGSSSSSSSSDSSWGSSDDSGGSDDSWGSSDGW
jgi:hypothetical protein